MTEDGLSPGSRSLTCVQGYAESLDNGFRGEGIFGDRPAILVENLKVTPNGVKSHRARFLERVSLCHEPRQRGTSHNVTALFGRLKDYRVVV